MFALVARWLFAGAAVAGLAGAGASGAVSGERGGSAERGSLAQGALQVVAFTTLEGTVRVFLPGDLAAGERLVGTVVAEPRGENQRAGRRGPALAGLGVRLAGQTTTVARGRLLVDLPDTLADASEPLALELIDGRGRVIASQPLALGEPAARSERFELPRVGQSARALVVRGPFDADPATTSARLGGRELPLLAESPRAAVFASAGAPVGLEELVVAEAGTELRAPYRNVAVALRAGRSVLAPGETTDLLIEASGLERLEQPLALDLRNTKPAVIDQEGGPRQHLVIEPAAVVGGRFTTTRRLTGLTRGQFTIACELAAPDPCACTCAAAIAGPDTLFRHWAPHRIPAEHRRPYLEAARYTADATFSCTGSGRPPFSSLQCAYQWTPPEGWSPSQLLAGLNTLSLFQPPASLLGQLERAGSVSFPLGVTASCPYRCGTIDASGDATVERSCSCSATKTVTLLACRDEAEAQRSAQECAGLRADLERAIAAAQAATERAASARQNLERAVQVYGRMIPVVCEGLASASGECNWAITLERIKIALSAAGAVAGGVGGALEGRLAHDLYLALVELGIVVGSKLTDSLDTGQCEAVVAGMQQQLIEYKIKACEFARPFRDARAELSRALDGLRRALDGAGRYRGCVPCDLADLIARGEQARRAAEEELETAAAAARQHAAWLDYCARQTGYTAQNAADICTDAPPVP